MKASKRVSGGGTKRDVIADYASYGAMTARAAPANCAERPPRVQPLVVQAKLTGGTVESGVGSKIYAQAARHGSTMDSVSTSRKCDRVAPVHMFACDPRERTDCLIQARLSQPTFLSRAHSQNPTTSVAGMTPHRSCCRRWRG